MPRSLKGWFWAIAISMLVIGFVFRVTIARQAITGLP